jgi:hypothetical protein
VAFSTIITDKEHHQTWQMTTKTRCGCIFLRYRTFTLSAIEDSSLQIALELTQRYCNAYRLRTWFTRWAHYGAAHGKG